MSLFWVLPCYIFLSKVSFILLTCSKNKKLRVTVSSYSALIYAVLKVIYSLYCWWYIHLCGTCLHDHSSVCSHSNTSMAWWFARMTLAISFINSSVFPSFSSSPSDWTCKLTIYEIIAIKMVTQRQKTVQHLHNVAVKYNRVNEKPHSKVPVTAQSYEVSKRISVSKISTGCCFVSCTLQSGLFFLGGGHCNQECTKQLGMLF